MIVSFSALLSEDQEMTPASNARDAHAQYFVANDELLLSMLKILAQFTRWLRSTRNDGCFQSACSSRTVRPSVAYTNDCSVVEPLEKQSYPSARRAWPPAGIIFCSNINELDVELQHMVFCTEFLDGWWSWEPLRRSCVRCGWCLKLGAKKKKNLILQLNI